MRKGSSNLKIKELSEKPLRLQLPTVCAKMELTGRKLSLIHVTVFHKQTECYDKMLCLMTRLTVISYLIALQEKESVNQCIKDLKAMAPA